MKRRTPASIGAAVVAGLLVVVTGVVLARSSGTASQDALATDDVVSVGDDSSSSSSVVFENEVTTTSEVEVIREAATTIAVAPTAPPATKPKSTTAPKPTRPDPGPAPDFPETNPIQIEGAVEVFYMAENVQQAAMYKLPPTHARSWGIRFPDTGDPVANYKLLIDTMKAAGATITSDEIKADPANKYQRISGRYRGWSLTVLGAEWDRLTITLIVW